MSERLNAKSNTRKVELTKTSVEVGMEGFGKDFTGFMEDKIKAMEAVRPKLNSFKDQTHRTFEWTPDGQKLLPDESPYTKDEIGQDLGTLARRKREYGKPATDEKGSSREALEYIERQSKKLSGFMEAMLVENGGLLFDNATVHPVSEFTDLVQGIDAVVAVRNAGGSIAQIMGLDFTFADDAKGLQGKLENSIRGIVKGELASAKYLRIDGKNIDAQIIPKVTLPLSAETVKDIGEKWRTKGTLERSDMPERDALLCIIEGQLAMQAEVATHGPVDLFRPDTVEPSRTPEQRSAAMGAALHAARAYVGDLWSEDAVPEDIPDIALSRMDKLLGDDTEIEIFKHAVAQVKEENEKYAERQAAKVAKVGQTGVASTATDATSDRLPEETERIEELREILQTQTTHETVPTTVPTEEVVRDINRPGSIIGIPHILPPEKENPITHIPHIPHVAHSDDHHKQSAWQTALGTLGAALGFLAKGVKELPKFTLESAINIFGPTFKNVFGDLKKAAQKAFGSIFKSSGSKKEAHAGHH